MVTRLARIVFLIFLLVTVVAPYAWGQGREVTIVYSNNINGQIYPAG
jgi:hypothetical protein